MTWIIGRAGPFGHAIGISDVRITLPDGREVDCLRKIYKVGNDLALGFAGSVAIGLEAVAQMTAALNLYGLDRVWDPLYIGRTVPDGLRLMFNSCSPQERELGCELMLLSAHPIYNDGPAPWARCYVHRFRAPDFTPIESAPAEIVSIGSGVGVREYSEALERLGKDMEMFKLEVGFPGGSGIALLSSISSLLAKVPTPGISQHLEICLVGRGSVRRGHFSHEGDEGPRLANSMLELRDLLQDMGITALECAVG
jgi:hypothetical protein